MTAPSALGGAARDLRELAERFALTPPAVVGLGRLLELIRDDPAAPTTVREPRSILRDHFADSLVALDLETVRDARLLVDIGSGAGFPGLPLALANPAAALVLLESNQRKTAFIDSAIRACRIANAQALATRAELWQEGRDRADVVTARALAALDVVAEYAAPLLRVGGVLVAWRGRRDATAERHAERAAALLGLEVAEVVPVKPYREAEHRHLHVMLKVMDTPRRFPRRVGVAARRPLGRSDRGHR